MSMSWKYERRRVQNKYTLKISVSSKFWAEWHIWRSGETKTHLLHFLQERNNVCSELLQFFVGFFKFELVVVALLLNSLGPGVSSALVRVTQRLETRFVLLEVLFLKRERLKIKYWTCDKISGRRSDFVKSIKFSPKESQPVPRPSCW